MQRAVKLAKYWPDCGIDLHVLTAGHAHYPLLDDSLLNDIDPRVTVHRVCGFDPGGLARRIKSFGRTNGEAPTERIGTEQRIYWRLQSLADQWATPEPEAWWVGSAVRAARRIIQQGHIDAIVTTSPPHSVQRVGIELRRSTGVPWIADLRDPIVDNFAYAPKRPAIDRCWQQLEAEIAATCDRVVVTCDDYANRWRTKYPNSAGNVACITNGYDESDRPTVARKPRSDRFVIAHVGAFYQSQSIEPILHACRSAHSTKKDAEDSLALRLIGSVSRQQLAFLTKDDDGFVERVGYKRHANAVAEMASADALFLMTPTHDCGRYCIPAKTFEYLAFGRRILALVHRGSSADHLLKQAGVETRAFHDDPDSLVRLLESAHRDWNQNESPPASDPTVMAEYRRDRLAARFAQLVTTCVKSRHAATVVNQLEIATA